MSNTSYYLYQKYVKYGSQDWIPVYPPEYAISGDTGQNPVIKLQNDPNCGYFEPEYRWHQEDISEDYICSAGTKYYVEIYQVSYDGGFTWQDVSPEQTRKGSVYESGSSDCIEYRWVDMDISTDWICDECPDITYRWVVVQGEYECSGTTKMTKEKKQYSIDSGTTWQDVTPPEYRTGSTVIEYDSEDCGYIEPQYRWTATTGYVCSGTDKMTKEIEQVSYDSGTTWQNVAPEVSRAALPMIESASTDCGYVPTPTGYSSQYLTFVPTSGSSTFGWNDTSTVYYSLDSGSTWSSMTSGERVTVNNGNKIYWKATLTPSSYFPYRIGRFSSTGNYDIEGNVMSLLYGDNFVGQTDLTGKAYVFSNLFSGCTGVTSAENLVLPATTLAGYCYNYMFNGCKSLTIAPELPATTLAQYCYESMFDGCTSLRTAPELPATTLAESCYQYMFHNCTSLTAAPELPATTLAQHCYTGMFYGCTSLTAAPELSATTLAHSCYSNMFYGCTSLTTAPTVLPAATLTSSCYDNMFGYCTSLTTAPQLPATTLEYQCYYEMFWGCTSLTTAPELPATTLANNCYEYMFKNCTSLSAITCLATNISANFCTYNWLSNVSNSGTFTKAASMTGWTTGVNGIPTNWTVQNYS